MADSLGEDSFAEGARVIAAPRTKIPTPNETEDDSFAEGARVVSSPTASGNANDDSFAEGSRIVSAPRGPVAARPAVPDFYGEPRGYQPRVPGFFERPFGVTVPPPAASHAATNTVPAPIAPEGLSKTAKSTFVPTRPPGIVGAPQEGMPGVIAGSSSTAQPPVSAWNVAKLVASSPFGLPPEEAAPGLRDVLRGTQGPLAAIPVAAAFVGDVLPTAAATFVASQMPIGTPPALGKAASGFAGRVMQGLGTAATNPVGLAAMVAAANPVTGPVVGTGIALKSGWDAASRDFPDLIEGVKKGDLGKITDASANLFMDALGVGGGGALLARGRGAGRVADAETPAVAGGGGAPRPPGPLAGPRPPGPGLAAEIRGQLTSKDYTVPRGALEDVLNATADKHVRAAGAEGHLTPADLNAVPSHKEIGLGELRNLERAADAAEARGSGAPAAEAEGGTALERQGEHLLRTLTEEKPPPPPESPILDTILKELENNNAATGRPPAATAATPEGTPSQATPLLGGGRQTSQGGRPGTWPVSATTETAQPSIFAGVENDRENRAGIPGQERVGQEPVQAEPVGGHGEEAPRTGGVVQGPQAGEEVRRGPVQTGEVAPSQEVVQGEAPADMLAQEKALLSGARKAILFHKAGPPPRSQFPPDGIEQVQTPAGTIWFRSDSGLSPTKVLEQSATVEGLGKLLEMPPGGRPPEENPRVVAVFDPDGNEVFAVEVTDKTRGRALKKAGEIANKIGGEIREADRASIVAGRRERAAADDFAEGAKVVSVPEAAPEKPTKRAKAKKPPLTVDMNRQAVANHLKLTAGSSWEEELVGLDRAAAEWEKGGHGTRADYFKALAKETIGTAPEPEPIHKPVEAPKVEIKGWETAAHGPEDVVETATGTEIPFHYAVVDAREPVTSHDSAGNPNLEYKLEGENIQNRNRSDQKSVVQMSNIKSNPKLRLLAAAPTTNEGAPLVRPDKRVIAGNGRMAGLAAAHEAGTAEQYKADLPAKLKQLGFDDAEIKKAVSLERPALVRLMTPGQEHDHTRLARDTNVSTGLTLGPAEKGRSDAGVMMSPGSFDETSRVLALYEANDDASLTAPKNRPFVEAFAKAFVPETERGSMFSEGRLTPDGASRVRAALVAGAYGNSPVVDRLLEGGGEETVALRTALINAAPDFAIVKMRQRIGELEHLDVVKPVIEAAEFINDMRSDGRSLESVLRPKYGELISVTDRLSPEGLELVQLIDQNKGPKGAKILSGTFRELAQVAAALTIEKDQGGLFGAGEIEKLPVPKLTEALKIAKENYEAKREAEDSPLFAGIGREEGEGARPAAPERGGGKPAPGAKDTPSDGELAETGSLYGRRELLRKRSEAATRLEKEIDRRYEAGELDGIGDLEQRLEKIQGEDLSAEDYLGIGIDGQFGLGESDLEDDGRTSIADELARGYARYLDATAKEGQPTGREDWWRSDADSALKGLRSIIEGSDDPAWRGQSPAGTYSDEQILDAAKDAYERKKSLREKYKNARPGELDRAKAWLKRRGAEIAEEETAYGQPAVAAPVFFSALSRAVDAIPFKSIPTADLYARLQKTPGVKKEELEWVGLPQWLKERDRVTKDEVKKFLDENNVVIRTHILEEPKTPNKGGRSWSPYASWTLPGGENYREIVLQKANPQMEALRARAEELSRRLEWLARPRRGEEYTEYTQEEVRDYEATRAEYVKVNGKLSGMSDKAIAILEERDRVGKERDKLAGTKRDEVPSPEYRKLDRLWWKLDEALGVQKDLDRGSGKLEFTGPGHYNHPDVIGHYRTKDRIDADGKKVLGVEEFQSDWHEQGRKRGYDDEGPEPVKMFAVIRKKYLGTVLAAAYAATAARYATFDTREAAEQEIETYPSAARDFLGIYEYTVQRENPDSVPNAPFKKSWPLLLFKHALRYAAENGYDRVAWTPGEVQNERYSLRKAVGLINWVSDGADRIVSISPTTGYDIEFKVSAESGRIYSVEAVGGGEFIGRSLDDVVGKDIAKRILSERYGRLSGEGLRVGGSGMIGFYDKILPAEIGKYIKQWGGKVVSGDVSIPGGASKEGGLYVDEAGIGMDEDATGWAIWDPEDIDGPPVEEGFATREEAEAALESIRVSNIVGSTNDAGRMWMHMVDITPAMREAALAGQPLFEPGAKYEQGRLFTGGDDERGTLPLRGPAGPERAAGPGTGTPAEPIAAGEGGLRAPSVESDRKGPAPTLAERVAERRAAEARGNAELERMRARVLATVPGGVGADDPLVVSVTKISDDIKKRGFISLLGYQVPNVEGLGVLAQITARPDFEVLRFVMTDDDGVVLDEVALSCGLPSTVYADHPDIKPEPLIALMTQRGATRWYMEHNHPGGDPAPSPDDLRATRAYEERIPGFAGHVVIDHESYCVIHPRKEGMAFSRGLDSARGYTRHYLSPGEKAARPKMFKDPTGDPANDLGFLVQTSVELAQAGIRFHTDEKSVTLLFANSISERVSFNEQKMVRLRAVASVPIEKFMDLHWAFYRLRAEMGVHGAQHVLAYHSGKGLTPAERQRLVDAGTDLYFLDNTISDLIVGEDLRSSVHRQYARQYLAEKAQPGKAETPKGATATSKQAVRLSDTETKYGWKPGDPLPEAVADATKGRSHLGLPREVGTYPLVGGGHIDTRTNVVTTPDGETLQPGTVAHDWAFRYGFEGEWKPALERKRGEPGELAETETEYGDEKSLRKRAFDRWFEGSVVTNDDGTPKVMYHGTRASVDFDTFDAGDNDYKPDLGSHFGTSEQANSIISANPEALAERLKHEGSIAPLERDFSKRVYPVYLSIKNPLRLVDMDSWKLYSAWTINIPANATGIEGELRKLATGYNEQQSEAARVGDNWDEGMAESEFLDDVKRLITKAGYDGVVYVNEHEAKDTEADSYIAFYPWQIKSATANKGTFDREDPSILFEEPPIYGKTPPSALEYAGRFAPGAARALKPRGPEDEVRLAASDPAAGIFSAIFASRAPKASKTSRLPSPLDSHDPEVERRMREAEGIVVPTVIERVKKAATDLEHSFTRHFIDLDTKESPTIALDTDILRQLEGAPEFAKQTALDTLAYIADGLDKPAARLFTRILALRDLQRDIEEGRYGEIDENGQVPGHIPYGYEDKAAVTHDLRRYEAMAEGDEVVAAALEKRDKYASALTQRLVDLELLPEDVLKDSRYYHRQVMSIVNQKEAAYVGTGSQDVRLHKKGFQKARSGGGDFNLRYQEAEFEWMAQAHSLIAMREALDRLREANDIKPGLENQAKWANTYAIYGGREIYEEVQRIKGEIAAIYTQGDIVLDSEDRKLVAGLNAKLDELDPLRPFSQRIGWNIHDLGKLAEHGELGHVDPEYEEAVDQLASSSEWEEFRQGGDDTPDLFFPLLNHLVEKGKAGSMEAAGIFKAIADRKKFIKTELGDEFKIWRDLMPEMHPLAPKSRSVIWQPEKGSMFYRAATLPERALDRFLEDLKQGDSNVVDKDEVEKLLGKAREALVLGGPKQEWVIPEGLAKTLDNWKGSGRERGLESLGGTLLQSWKQWVLLNPVRALRYNLNNMSGDVDVVIASPYRKALQGWGKAARDLWKYSVKEDKSDLKLNAEMQRATRLAVISSGLTVQEIPDINEAGAFKALTSDDPNIVQQALEKYWSGTKKASTWRENTLRLAVFRFLEAEIRAGRIGTYGASKAHEIEAIKDPAERAAKITRELIGDYGNISVAGQHIRRHMMPFYSWLEINAPRYVRLLKNAAREGGGGGGARGGRGGQGGGGGGGGAYVRAAGIGAKKLAFNYAELSLFAPLLYGAIQAWNNLMFPEEERLLGRSGKTWHLILGRNADGTIRTIRLQGALSDALDWAGAGNIVADIKDITEGRSTIGKKMKEAVTSPINKIVSGWNPFHKSLFELALGYKTYPSLFKEGSFSFAPKPIRDRMEYLADVVWPAGALYRKVTGKPKRPAPEMGVPGAGSMLDALVFLRIDPGEAAYWYSRDLTSKWLEEQGTPSSLPGGGQTGEAKDRADALYYFKRACEWSDDDAAKKWLEEYYKLGGTPQKMRDAFVREHPLGTIQLGKRGAFLNTLNDKDRGIVEDAVRWYEKGRERMRDVSSATPFTLVPKRAVGP